MSRRRCRMKNGVADYVAVLLVPASLTALMYLGPERPTETALWLAIMGSVLWMVGSLTLTR